MEILYNKQQPNLSPKWSWLWVLNKLVGWPHVFYNNVIFRNLVLVLISSSVISVCYSGILRFIYLFCVHNFIVFLWLLRKLRKVNVSGNLDGQVACGMLVSEKKFVTFFLQCYPTLKG